MGLSESVRRIGVEPLGELVDERQEPLELIAPQTKFTGSTDLPSFIVLPERCGLQMRLELVDSTSVGHEAAVARRQWRKPDVGRAQ